MEYLTTRFMASTGRTFIKINLKDKAKANVICNENGTVSILRNFSDINVVKINLYQKIIYCYILNGKIYLINILNQLLIFDIDSKQIINTLSDFQSSITYMISSLNILGCCCLKSEIYFMNLNDEIIIKFKTFQEEVYYICFEPKNEYFITADQTTICIWNFKSLIQIKTLKNNISSPFGKTIENIIWHKNGFIFAISHLFGIDFYERQSWYLKYKINSLSFYNFIQFSPKGLHILCASDSIISIYNIITLRKEFEIKDDSFCVNSLVWYENRILFSNRNNGSITMIKLNLVKTLPDEVIDQLDFQDICMLLYE